MLYEANEDTTLSNYDERDILSDFSSDIAIDSILMQIDKIFNENDVPKNSSDLFNIIIQKYIFLKTKYANKSELLSSLQDILEEILDNILNKLQEKLHFTITFNESLSFDDKLHYIHMIYSFFINYIENGIESLLYNYFINHIKEFPKKDVNKKDQSYINFKNFIQSDYLNQIYHYNDNIESIQEYNFVAEDIIDLMIEDDDMMECNYWISQIFIDNVLCDISFEKEFNSTIINLALNSNIKYKVQNRIIKKYLKKEEE